jgi:hypothetical protein
MSRIVCQEILEILGVQEGIVDNCNIDTSWDLESGSENKSADTTETIDSKHLRYVDKIFDIIQFQN